MILVVVKFCVPADVKVVMGGKAGNIGRDGVPITVPNVGVGPEYEVVVVTRPDTVPPPTTILPLTSTTNNGAFSGKIQAPLTLRAPEYWP